MNLTGIVEFVKYTLVVSAAGLAYTLEKFAYTSSSNFNWLVYLTLVLFVGALLSGVLVFGTVTKSMHDADIAARNEARTATLGTIHALSLFLAMLMLVFLVGEKIYLGNNTDLASKQGCCCAGKVEGQ